MSLWHPRFAGDMFKSDYDPDEDGVIEPPQVNDATKVEGETSGLREEHGTDLLAYWTANRLLKTVSYATAFSVTPYPNLEWYSVTPGANDATLKNAVSWVDGVGTTGFTANCWDEDGAFVSDDTQEFNWLVVGS